MITVTGADSCWYQRYHTRTWGRWLCSGRVRWHRREHNSYPWRGGRRTDQGSGPWCKRGLQSSPSLNSLHTYKTLMVWDHNCLLGSSRVSKPSWHYHLRCLSGMGLSCIMLSDVEQTAKVWYWTYPLPSHTLNTDTLICFCFICVNIPVFSWCNASVLV